MNFWRVLLHTSEQLPICSATIIFSFLLNWLLPAPIIGLCFFLQTVIGRSSDGKKTDASSRDYFQKTLEGRRVISSPLSSSVDNETLVVLTVPVYDKDQNIIGVFGGSIDVTELTTMLFEDLYSGSGYSFIADSDGNIISIESTHNEIRENFFTSSSDWVFQISEDGATLQEDFKQGHANCRKITADLSHARYISYQPLKYNDWMLCYIVPAVEARQHFAFINNFEIILFAFFICIVLLLIFALWKSQPEESDFASSPGAYRCSDRTSEQSLCRTHDFRMAARKKILKIYRL